MSGRVISVRGSGRATITCPSCKAWDLSYTPYFWLGDDGVTAAPANVSCTQCGFHGIIGGPDGV